MNLKFTIFFGIFFLLYGLCNYYIGLRGWQAFNNIPITMRLAWYWTGGVVLLSLSFPLGRFIAQFLPHDLGRIVIFIGSYWLAAMYYLFLILLACDLLRVINRWTGLLPSSLQGSFSIVTLAVMALVFIIMLVGTWNSLHPVIRNYEITISKKSSSLDTMRVVAASDIHLGWIVGIDRLKQMTNIINSLEPDLVLLPGDIVDEGVDLETEQELPEALRSLHPRFGTFAAMGNHEYISGNAEATIGFLNRAGITVLRDQWTEVGDGFYVVGRDDASRHRFNGSERLELSALMADIDKHKLPVILMDHEPFNLDVSEKEGVDLQFSGHTHLGQLFPNNYITRAIYEQDWGYLRKNNFQAIVSCGFGTWGPPIRIGNRPEIVNVLVHFSPTE
ncbi:MAG: metallophosphoesterase [Firmicutes bacterium HGW-Firmicutes-15]|nr:MAG: metallophosphoesterase [Firmicutes bacterium HGW-Firmicutes-15]